MTDSPNSRLFPAGLLQAEWQQFSAQGYFRPVTGVVYRGEPRPTCGMPLGGIDTGCLDLEPNGMLGYSTLFNDLVNPRRLLNLPFMGYHIDGRTRLLITDRKAKEDTPTPAASPHQFPPTDYTPRYRSLALDSVDICRSLDYWGHYPIADLEFDTGDDLGVGVRACSPFVPGDTATALMPGAIFRVHLRNQGSTPLSGSLLFSFPGFALETPDETDHVHRTPTAISSQVHGYRVERTSADPA